MASGCTKADRNRTSAANLRYKAGQRDLVNAKKRQARAAKREDAKHKRKMATPRGMARALDRWIDGITDPNQPSSLMPEKEWKRIKQSKLKPKPKAQPIIMFLGMPMTPQQAAVVARRVEAERKAERQSRETALA